MVKPIRRMSASGEIQSASRSPQPAGEDAANGPCPSRKSERTIFSGSGMGASVARKAAQHSGTGEGAGFALLDKARIEGFGAHLRCTLGSR